MKMLLTTLAALAIAGAANASSYNAYETDQAGGDFSNAYTQPSVISGGVTSVFGSQRNKPDVDWIMFEGFTAGTTKLDFLFTNDGGAWGGLNLRIKKSPFTSKNDWWPLAYSQSISNVTDSNPLSFSFILDGYTGPLHMVFDFYKDNDFKNGNGLGYQITAVGGPTTALGAAPALSPSPVPLPPGLPLALAGLGALALLRRRHRARRPD
jgi:hypothetical protein